MNPVSKKPGLSIRKNLFIEISLQVFFIAVYFFKLIQSASNYKLIIAYLASIFVLIMYLSYCIYAFSINKYPNHYLWVFMKIITYLTKFAILAIDIHAFIVGENTTFDSFIKNISVLYSIILIIVQLIFDFTKAFNYNFTIDYREEDNKVGLAFLYFTMNPILGAFFIYNVAKLFDSVTWLWVLNLVFGIIFLLISFMFFTKITINNLLVVFGTIIALIDTIYVTIYSELSGNSIIYFEGIGRLIEISVYWGVSFILSVIMINNFRNGYKFIYKKGEYPAKY